MNIEIIKNPNASFEEENYLNSTKEFGIFLNKIILSVKMMHWYVQDYNAHHILGKLYDGLSDLFDTLQEEIIGITKSKNKQFPNLNCLLEFENFELYKDNQAILNNFYNISDTLKNILSSLEFNGYVDTTQSGINNTKEEIISLLNKTEYLIGLLKL